MNVYGQLFLILSLIISLNQADDEKVLRVNLEFLYDSGVAVGPHNESVIPGFIKTLVKHTTSLLKRPGLNMNIDLQVVREKQVMSETESPSCSYLYYPSPDNSTVDLNPAQFTVVLIYNGSVVKNYTSWQNQVKANADGLCNPGKSCAEIYWNGNMENGGHNLARALVMSMGAGKDGTTAGTPCNQTNSIMQINSTVDSNSTWSKCTVEIVQEYLKRNNGACIKNQVANQTEVENPDSKRIKRSDYYDDSDEEEVEKKQEESKSDSNNSKPYVININANVTIDVNK